MKKQRLNIRRFSIATIALTSFFGAQRVFTEFKLQNLTRERSHAAALPQFQNAQDREIWMSAAQKRNRRFAQLWLERQQRDISTELLDYVDDPALVLRTRAVRALGRLESREAEAPLQTLLAQAADSQVKSHEAELPSITLKLALARIKARSLTGQSKLDAISDSVGLSWREILLLSNKVNADNGYKDATDGEEIIGEIVALLYTMGKEGEDIRSFATALKLSPAQEVLIQAASISTEQEIKLILERLSHPKGTRGGAYLLADHLVGLGPIAIDLALERLQDMLKHPENYQQQLGYKMMFRPVSLAADRRALPLLQQFEKSKNPYIKDQAITAQRYIKRKIAIPNFPA